MLSEISLKKVVYNQHSPNMHPPISAWRIDAKRLCKYRTKTTLASPMTD